MKELEKIVKESFQDFEPDVHPSVWQRLEQSLPASQPADPSSVVSGSKGMLAVSGKMTAWIAGVIGTAVITTAVILSVPDKNGKATVNEESPSVKVETPVINNNTAESVSQQLPDEVVTEQKSETVKEETVSVQPSDKQETPIQPSIANVQESRSEAVSGNRHEVVKQEASAPKDKEEAAPPVSSQPLKEEVKKFEPVIIVSSDCGFAPLKVIALLNDESSKGNWDFGDGYAISSSATATHVYERPGTYELNYTDDKKTINRTIDVIGTISTAFTPNGDGLNDEFYINAPLSELRMKIFDRSGHPAIEINNPDQRWDGRNFNGDDLPSGTYFYDIFARSANGKTISQKGTITIFR